MKYGCLCIIYFLSFFLMPSLFAQNGDSVAYDTSVYLTDSLSNNTQEEIIPVESDSLPDTLSIIAVGDVMLGSNYPSASLLPPGNNCAALLSPVKSILQDADLSFCNLEGTFAGNSGTAKTCKDPSVCYVFRMPDSYVSCITEAGFDFVSVANNHVNDFGYAGKMHTAKILQEAGVFYAGFVEQPYILFKSGSFTIGFCAFSTNSGVMDLRNIAQAEEIVRFLADTCDIVIVSMHGGAEGKNYQHITRQTETFLGADRGNVYKFSHKMIDAGADIILGHGPHVTRAMEIYKNRIIAYSMGNFATYGRINISGPSGIAPIVKIFVNREGEFIKGQVIPIIQRGEGGPVIDTEKRVIFKLQELIHTDFPGSILKINNEGDILKSP